MSNNIVKLCQGDLIALHGSDSKLGYLCLPPVTEPLPEREETISHLRASPSSIEQSKPDFTERCLFRIADEKGQVRKGEPVHFGSIVRLIHEPSAYTVVASDSLDHAGDGVVVASVFLRSLLNESDETSSQWYIVPKFRLRLEGDHVQEGDFVLFKSVKYKGKILTITHPSSDPDKYDHLVGVDKNSHMHSGWQLKSVSYTHLTLPTSDLV